MYTSDFVNCLIKYGVQCYTPDGHKRDKIQINNDINNIWDSLSQDMKDDIIFNWHKQTDDIQYQYIIVLKSSESNRIIETYKLDVRSNNGALTLYLIQHFDDNSVVEFYGEKFKVKNWNISHIKREIEIYI